MRPREKHLVTDRFHRGVPPICRHDHWVPHDLKLVALANTGTHPAVYGATLDLTIGNDAGVLGRICTLIGEKKANISNLEFVDRKPDFYRLMINVELRDIEQLHSLMLMLEAESDVAAVERYRDMNSGKPGAQ